MLKPNWITRALTPEQICRLLILCASAGMDIHSALWESLEWKIFPHLGVVYVEGINKWKADLWTSNAFHHMITNLNTTEMTYEQALERLIKMATVENEQV